MNRPRIICHMLMALDGKITGPFMEAEATNQVNQEFERTNSFFNPQAWLCGRVTSDDNFTFYRKPELTESAQTVPGGDFVAVNNAPMYYVSVDASGKLAWQSNELKYENRPTAHIIEVLTGKATNAYKDFLRRMNISYIIAGNDGLDCKLASEKLLELFGIETLMVSGGGYINGSFLNEGLIDELSLVVAPVADSESDTVTLFERADYLPAKAPAEFSLISVEKLEGDGLWLRYKTKR